MLLLAPIWNKKKYYKIKRFQVHLQVKWKTKCRRQFPMASDLSSFHLNQSMDNGSGPSGFIPGSFNNNGRGRAKQHKLNK